MTYDSPQALRMALEQRLLARANSTGVSLDRLRRRVLFERIVARLEAAEPGRWVLKGGMALEVRLRDGARLTKDIDLGLRDDVASAAKLHDRLTDVLSSDPHGDRFVLTATTPTRLQEDRAGHLTWRTKVAASLAGKSFGGVQLDISPREHELDTTDRIKLPGSLDFAGIPTPVVEIIDVHRHAAEKFHGMLRDLGDRDNTRVRDLVDLVILIEHDLLAPAKLAITVRQVWAERERTEPPHQLPALPEPWRDRYPRLVSDLDVSASSFGNARASVEQLWALSLRSEIK